MFDKIKYLNYITIICITLTLIFAIYSYINDSTYIISFVFLVITLIVYYINNRLLASQINLTKEDKEKLNIGKGEKNGKKSSSNNR